MTGEAHSRRQSLPELATVPPPIAAHAPERDLLLWLDPGKISGAQLGELLDLAVRGAALHAIAAAGIIGAFWFSPQRFEATAAALAVAVLMACFFVARRLRLAEDLPARGAKIGFWIATGFAAAVGTAWGAVPLLLLPDASDGQQLVLLAAVTAVLADVQRLGASRKIGLAYAGPICAGSCLGLALSGMAAGLAVALVMPFFGWHLVSHGVRIRALAIRRLVDGVTAAAQGETIRALLLDFDEEPSDWFWRTDHEGRLAYLSEESGAASLDAAKGGSLASLFARAGGRPDDGARSVLALMKAHKPFRNRLVEIRGEAEPQWWRLSGKPLFDAGGRFMGYRGIGCDVSGARNSESRIAYLANYDGLTGFANRSNFQAYASRQTSAAATDGHCRALLCLDLDGFKGVNDTLGHEGGDELLKEVAARLTATAPNETFLARIGGDEFALWIQETTPVKAEAAANALIASLSVPFEINGCKVEIGGSIGIALTPKHGTGAEELLVKADLALYRAKSEGKGRAKLFEEAFETEINERRQLEHDLKLALARGEFELHYQPLVDMADGRVVCFEALIRWRSPERGFVSPGEFIPAAEGAGLISAVGRYVLFEACRTAASWPQDVQVAVNVSPPHVRSSDFLLDVTLALKSSGLHPSRLQIEVTEGVFLERSETAASALQTLRTRGVKIALDDFGTGYSSLNYLVDFPVDKIKIDRAFVRDLAGSEKHQAIVDAMLGLARRLSIRVTAEGVETKDQAVALKRRRCDDIQGYLLSKPRPASDVPEMIAEVPVLFRQAIPTHMDSPLAMALAVRKVEAGQAA